MNVDIIQSILTLNPCYTANKKITVQGIMLHSVGCPQPNASVFIKNWNKKRTPKVQALDDITYKTAFIIGLFQVLSMIPGTSRSGATIIGALLIGVSRTAAAEFTFYLAVPVMAGASLLKLLKFGLHFTGMEFAILLVGMVSAFAVSLFIIRFLMNYIRKHDFTVFGWYRIVLGVLVLICAAVGII